MALTKSKSGSKKMETRKAFKILELPLSASPDEINQTFSRKLAVIQAKYEDRPDTLVQEADNLYAAYRSAFLSKEGTDENQVLPLTITGPDTLLNMFGISDIPHQSLQVQMHQQAKFEDGQLVKKESNRTESFINKDGKREVKVYENGKLVKHTIGGKNMLK